MNKLDNSNNNKATNVWSLQNPTNQDWQEGSVSVSSDGEIQYQVSIGMMGISICLLINRTFVIPHVKY